MCLEFSRVFLSDNMDRKKECGMSRTSLTAQWARRRGMEHGCWEEQTPSVAQLPTLPRRRSSVTTEGASVVTEPLPQHRKPKQQAK